MSEEVIGLVWLHCFSPINTKVKYCTGRESRERHAKVVKTVSALSRRWPSLQPSLPNQFSWFCVPFVLQHKCNMIRRVDKKFNIVTLHIASSTRFSTNWTLLQPSSRANVSAWSYPQTQITKYFHFTMTLIFHMAHRGTESNLKLDSYWFYFLWTNQRLQQAWNPVLFRYWPFVGTPIQLR